MPVGYKSQGKGTIGTVNGKSIINFLPESSFRHEMRDLIDSLFTCSNPGQLPDGKIVFTIFASEEIERRFNR